MKLNRTNMKITSLIFATVMIASVFAGFIVVTPHVEAFVNVHDELEQNAKDVFDIYHLELDQVIDEKIHREFIEGWITIYDYGKNWDQQHRQIPDTETTTIVLTTVIDVPFPVLNFTSAVIEFANLDHIERTHLVNAYINHRRAGHNESEVWRLFLEDLHFLRFSSALQFADKVYINIDEVYEKPDGEYARKLRTYFAFVWKCIQFSEQNELWKNVRTQILEMVPPTNLRMKMYTTEVRLFIDFPFNFWEEVTAPQISRDYRIITPTTIGILYNNEVRTLNLEEYLKGVVQAETGPYFMKTILMKSEDWPEDEQYRRELTNGELQELLKAQAVVARSYAVAAINGMKTTGNQYGVHVVTDERDQVWRPPPTGGYDQRVIDAVEATRNQVITHPGNRKDGVYDGVIGAFFYSYGNLKNLPFCKTLVPTQATWLNNRSYLQSVDSYGPLTTIETYSIGHGVGMSQWGAAHLSARGFTYVQIIEHYFTGISTVEAGRIANNILRFEVHSPTELKTFDSAG